MNGLCTDKYAQEFTAEYFKDAFLALDSSKKGGTVATFNNKKNNANMTLASQRIDQIYVHGNIDLQYYCADNRQYDGQYPSDHIPLYILAKF